MTSFFGMPGQAVLSRPDKFSFSLDYLVVIALDALITSTSVIIGSCLPILQVHTRTVEVSRRKKTDWEVLGSCKVAQRVYTVPEIELMARFLHLDVVHFHGSLNMELDNLFHEDAHEMVVIMRKPLST